jgi:trigger factor
LTAEIIDVNSCKKNLTVEIPAQDVEKETDKIAREYARNAKVPGFRPGKVPLSIVHQRFGTEILQEATQKLIEQAWKDAINEHDLHPLAQPEIHDVDNKPGSSLKFTVSFEVLPPLEVKEYKGLSITMPPSEIADENVNQTIDMFREQHSQFAPLEGAEAADGHYLTVTVDGMFEGEDSTPSHEEDITLVVGNPQTNADFSNNLRGAKAGETREFDVSYPDDYHRQRFAGKKVHYSVLVKEIKEKQVPELNEDFARDLGYEGLEAFRAKVREDLVKQARQSDEKKTREALLDMLVERQTIEIPECMVQDEMAASARRMASSLAYQGIDLNKASIDWKKLYEEDRPRAEQAVRRSIFLDAIARQESLGVTDEEIDSELQVLAEGTNKSAAAWRAQLEKEDRIQSFEQHLRQNKALDFIYRNANISVG